MLRIIKPDIIHSLLWSAGVMTRVIAYLLGIRHVSAVHAHCNAHGTVREVLDGMTLPLADIIVAVSDDVAQSIQKCSWSRAGNNIMVIKNAIAVEKLYKDAQQQEVMLPAPLMHTRYFIIGSVGRLHTIKRYDVLIQAFALFVQRYPQAYLMIVGSGSQEKPLQDLVMTLGLVDNVFFIMHAQAAGYYQFFDCFVQPSESEGISLALLEAMAYQLPVVVAAPHGHHAVVTDTVEGIVVPACNVQLFCEALVYLYNASDERVRMGEAGSAKVRQEFSYSAMLACYRELFIHT